MKKGIRPEAKKALVIGLMCSLSYLAVYVARNALSAASPQMIEGGVFTTEQIGTLSSAYFIVYAVGQLINGAIGDKIKAKYMISFGLMLAGTCSLLFMLCTGNVGVSGVLYAMTGFFLAMIYGPMTKVIAENVEPIYAPRCSLGYTCASFFGSPAAGFLAAILVWSGVFSVSGGLLIGMGIVCFIAFTVFEKKGIVTYGRYRKAPWSREGIKELLERDFLKFIVISILTGVIRTSVVFWLPTYLSQHLGFPSDTAAWIFTASTLALSCVAFVAVFVFERMKRQIGRVQLLFFSLSAVCFLLVYFLRQPVLNVIFLVLAIFCSNGAACMIWTQYCPSLRDTGLVSGATGFLDFVSYMAASVSSAVFANAVDTVGWGWLILIWFGLVTLGVFTVLPYKKLKKQNSPS